VDRRPQRGSVQGPDQEGYWPRPGADATSGAVPPETSPGCPSTDNLARFYADREAERFDRGAPLHDVDAVSGLIARFSPAEVPPETWARIEGPVRAWAEAVRPATPQRARNLLNALTQLALWADTHGLALEPDVLLRPGTIDRFIVQGCAHLAKGTRTNYRTQLRAVGREVVDPDLFPPQPVELPRTAQKPPYSPKETTALLSMARALPTPKMRRNMLALLAMGLGAGLRSQEMSCLVGTDVVTGDDGIAVHVPPIGDSDPRLVPVLSPWEEEIAALAGEAGRHPLFLPERDGVRRHHIPNFVGRCSQTSGGDTVSVERLRITWIVRHLEAGVPVPVLARAAGVLPAQLTKYLVFVALPSDDEARRLLRRGAGS